MDDMKDFIKRAEEVMKPAVREAVNRTTRYNYKYVRKSDSTEQGKARRRVYAKQRRLGWKDCLDEEIWKVREFYGNRPKGMVIDHIIPLSEGGKHELSNLQYLTPAQNSSKGKRETYHKCFD
jgi:5-methylcytosine-specific restriction endonuclease McrA